MYEVKVNYVRQTGEDNPGTVKETYLVDGVTPGDAQNLLLEEIKPFIFGDCELPSVRNRKFFEIIETGNGTDLWEGKIEQIVTEDSGAEKRRPCTFLIKANDISDALSVLKDATKGYDCNILAVKKSQIIDIIHGVK
ncbi:MAG: DUF4494 family protein [Prevotella sp.]|nr:DUF4494 family protein [Prevotella sp.]